MISKKLHLLVICAQRYNGHELWTSLGIYQERGHTFEVVSTDLIVRDELTMQPNKLERLVYDVQPEEIANLDAIVVVSGNMSDTEGYWDDHHVHALLSAAREQKKVIAAICCSVPTLSPIARGVKVSFFPLIRSRHALAQAGAISNPVALTVDADARIVTAEHQMATQMWAEETCNMLEGKPQVYFLTKSKFTPKGRLRRMPKEVEKMIEEAKQQKSSDNGL